MEEEGSQGTVIPKRCVRLSVIRPDLEAILAVRDPLQVLFDYGAVRLIGGFATPR
jgi:hypothetical protein